MVNWQGLFRTAPRNPSFIKFALIALAALLVAWLVGGVPALAGLALYLFITAYLDHRNLTALAEWLKAPAGKSVPDAVGKWGDVFVRLYRLMRRGRQSEAQLQRALLRFQDAAAALPDGVVWLNDAFEIEWCNPLAEQHFDIEHARDRGQPITYLVRQPEFANYLAQGDSAEPLVLRAWRSSGLTLSLQLVPYGDKQKLLISRDITRLERAETVRRDFIANVSHELRTPITVVGGFLETLQDMERADTKLLSRSISLMREQTARMQRLVEDLLTLSRLESGQPPIEEPVDVPAMLRTLEREAEQLSKGKQKVLGSVQDSHWLLGSEAELHSAFLNLVTNAVRYTPAGGEVRLSWSVRGVEGVFAVEDTGIGIEAQHIARLTERFYRVDRSRSRESGGTGLGLAIVKHVLNRHQARLNIESEPGKGSRFEVVFSPHRLLTPPAMVVKEGKDSDGLRVT